jgi:hypothetical protein
VISLHVTTIPEILPIIQEGLKRGLPCPCGFGPSPCAATVGSYAAVARCSNGCRDCMHLAYANESESPLDRSWRTVRQLEARVENRTGTRYVRPKGMHWRTLLTYRAAACPALRVLCVRAPEMALSDID